MTNPFETFTTATHRLAVGPAPSKPVSALRVALMMTAGAVPVIGAGVAMSEANTARELNREWRDRVLIERAVERSREL